MPSSAPPVQFVSLALPAPNWKAISLSPRRNAGHITRFDRDHQVFTVKWHDNAVVTLASNFQSHKALLTISRYLRTEKKFATIPQPNLISSHNAHMGG